MNFITYRFVGFGDCGLGLQGSRMIELLGLRKGPKTQCLPGCGF